MNAVHIQKLQALLRTGLLKLNESLARHTSLGIGGPAEIYIAATDTDELAGIMRYASQEALPITFLGKGSNCLIHDRGIAGIVLHPAGLLKEATITGNSVTVGAGMQLKKFVEMCVAAGLSGMEALASIPGTLGGALIMNAGAFGEEISTCLISIESLTPHGELIQRKAEAIQFGYRKSDLPGNEFIVSAQFEFPPGDPAAGRTVMRETLRRRNAVQPVNARSAGSIFKNPEGHAAGQLIDAAGLKGARAGGAEISTKHANFIINQGNATAADIAYLINLATRTIKQQFDIALEMEIKPLGFPADYFGEVQIDHA